MAGASCIPDTDEMASDMHEYESFSSVSLSTADSVT